MKKSDLKTLHYLRFENGAESIVMLSTENGDVMVAKSIIVVNGFKRLHDLFSLDNLNEDLTDGSQHKQLGNVMEVKDQYGETVWVRQEQKVKLNEEHTATILEKERVVKVGCQEFTFAKIEELHEAISTL